MTRNANLLDALRSGLTPLENHLIDGYVDGRVNRREFLRHGSLLGLSLPFLGRLTLAAGFGAAPSLARAAIQPGATIRVASNLPTAAIDPVKTGDPGGLLMLQQVGEFLCVAGPDLTLQPCLATSWKPNQDGSVWTLTLRKGVKFHSGGEMTADDVVATMDRLTGKYLFRGILQKGATRKVDDNTVEFHLDSPNGKFPYLVSSENFNAIILPANYSGDFEKAWDGTGPFKIEKYTQNVGASFVRNDDYWGPKALPAKTEFTFHKDVQSQILAFQAGQVDIIGNLPALAGVALLNDPTLNLVEVKSAAFQQVHMRCDIAPFTDPRVRQAVALCLDRDKLVKGLMKGKAVLGNDSPFAPIYPSTGSEVPQRKQDVAKAKQLMKAAGMDKGFQAALVAAQALELPAYAQLIQAWVREIGIDLNLNMMDLGSYFGDGKFGNSKWLDSTIGITTYGHRGVPDVLLSALLLSEGAWNSSHFKNKEYDTLVKGYIASLDLEAQRATAGKIQRLLLEETPALYTYFFTGLAAAKKGVAGFQPTAIGQLFLHGAGKDNGG